MGRKPVYLSIREAIIKGKLKPGQPLAEESLSRLFGVSRTPIREALIKLESEGLVTIIKNFGTFVREMTASDICEVFQLRILLESFAALSVCQNDRYGTR